MQNYDKIIIGAGLYGLYAALFCGKKGLNVLVLEKDPSAFSRATYVNQARVHMGYHYPRSLSTAVKSAGYFSRFCKDFDFCIHKSFDQVYATSSNFSWTDASQFKAFCENAGIRCDEVAPGKYFQPGACDGAFLTTEYTYDAMILRDYFLQELAKLSNVTIRYDVRIQAMQKDSTDITVILADGTQFRTPFVLNATYAAVNEILSMLCPQELFAIKYELCEIILCKPGDSLRDVGITVMDGPFFSIMPFGKTGYHSLTSVTFTPHSVSYDTLPTFPCQQGAQDGAAPLCDGRSLGNCNACPHHPKSAWPYMSHLADKYLKPEYTYEYQASLFSMKPILKSSEVDDSRPTAIKVHFGKTGEKEPVFISVLSGKINTVYDLDDYLA